MENHIKKIREHLDKQEDTRDELLDISHRVIRKSSSAMASLHRDDNETVSVELKEMEKEITKLNKILKTEPQFSEHGTVIAAYREFSEVILTKSLINEEKLPGPDEINVIYKGYAQALAETIGELRRHLLNLLREDEVEEAQQIHERMEGVFDTLEQLDYPDSILPGFRHRRDGARKTLEKTRTDITRAIRERELERALSKTETKMEGEK